jgi:hypothetical protein
MISSTLNPLFTGQFSLPQRHQVSRQFVRTLLERCSADLVRFLDSPSPSLPLAVSCRLITRRSPSDRCGRLSQHSAPDRRQFLVQRPSDAAGAGELFRAGSIRIGWRPWASIRNTDGELTEAANLRTESLRDFPGLSRPVARPERRSPTRRWA